MSEEQAQHATVPPPTGGFCPYCGATGSAAIVGGASARWMPYLLFGASALAALSALVKIEMGAEISAASFAWIAAATFLLAGSLWLHFVRHSRRCLKCDRHWILSDA